MSVGKTVARNTAFNTAGRLWEALVGLILVAYIVAKVGAANYGLWAVVGAFTGYAALLDLGVGSAYTKYIAEHAARHEKAQISSVVSTGFFFYLAFGLLFIAITWPAVGFAIGFIEAMDSDVVGDLGDSSVLVDLKFLVQWGLVLFALTNCIAPFTAVQTGLQRMGVTNGISVCMSMVKVIATVTFLQLGYGLRGLLYANAVVLALFACASIVTAFVIFPSLRISTRQVSSTTFRRLFRFGWRTQVSRLSNLIMFETDVVVIAIVLRDLELTGLYKIGLELANKMRQVPGVLLTALVPAASELDARDEREKLKLLYLHASKYVAAVTLPLVGFVVGCAVLLIKAWMGEGQDLAYSAGVLQILAIGYIANVIPGAGVTVALGTGRPDLQMKAGLISMTANILLTVFLAVKVGFWGIPIATALSMFISWAWFAQALGRELEVGPVHLFRSAILWPTLASVPGFLVCLLMTSLGSDLAGRLPNFAAAAVSGLILFALYLFAIRSLPFFDDYDIGFFDGTLGLDRVPGYRMWSRSLRDG